MERYAKRFIPKKGLRWTSAKNTASPEPSEKIDNAMLTEQCCKSLTENFALFQSTENADKAGQNGSRRFIFETRAWPPLK